jgi:hypothetical protein
MKAFCTSANGQLTLSLLLVAAVFAAFAIGGDTSGAVVSAALLLVFVVVVHVGRRRSGTLEVMSGIGDERTKALYTRACASMGTALSFFLPGYWLVTVAQGEPNTALSLTCAVAGVSFVVSVAVLARRG